MDVRQWSVRFLGLLAIMFAAMIYKRVNDKIYNVAKPQLNLSEWWGDGPAPSDWAAYVRNSSEVVGNKLLYADTTIDDLRTQLNRTLRLTSPLEDVNFEYGFNTHELQRIIQYWRDDYLPRWREREVFLWQFNHFTTDIQGLRMHFLHLMVYDENKVGKHHYPVLLLHGWPSSVREFYPLIHELHQTYPSKSNKYIFNVVAPSLPGYAWSQGTSKKGLGPAQIAVILRNLMMRLGYTKFFIHGGDWGSVIGSHMATLFPEHVLGYHSTMCSVMTGRAIFKGVFRNMLPTVFGYHIFEQYLFPKWHHMPFLLTESGYFHLQATKPDTIGTALTDNPIGLAAYILEKWSTWTSPDFRNQSDGGLTKAYKLDALLDNVMIYYLTNSITTSQRLYAEAYSKEHRSLRLDRVPTDVPTGCVRFKHELIHFSDAQLVDKYRNLIYSKFYSKGGHFIALEWPKVLHHDFVEFVKKVEEHSKLPQF